MHQRLYIFMPGAGNAVIKQRDFLWRIKIYLRIQTSDTIFDNF